MTKTTDSPIYCACGCGRRTAGGNFKMGHDQRLRGMLKRGESIKTVTRSFITKSGKRSEWAKLLHEGKQAPKAKLSDKTRGKRAKRATKARKVARVIKQDVREGTGIGTSSEG